MKTPEELAEEYAPTFEDIMKQYTEQWDGCPYILGFTKGITAVTLAYGDGYGSGFLAGYQAATPQWISVKDRLPEEFNDYVAFGYGPTIPARHFLAEYEPKTKRWYERDHDWDLTDTILYWMPLPKPPEE